MSRYEKLSDAVRDYAKALGYVDKANFPYEPIVEYPNNECSIRVSEALPYDHSFDVYNKVIAFLTDTGIEPRRLGGMTGFGQLTDEQQAAAIAKLQRETIALTGHNTIAEFKGSQLAAEFDKKNVGEPPAHALQALIGLINASDTIPLNARRRLAASIGSELETRVMRS